MFAFFVQGLNLIKKVVDIKGEKRFKINDVEKIPGELTPADFNGGLDANNAKNIFRKMQTTSAYAQQFGTQPKVLSTMEDHKVVHKQAFSTLDIARIMKPDAREYVSKWLQLND